VGGVGWERVVSDIKDPKLLKIYIHTTFSVRGPDGTLVPFTALNAASLSWLKAKPFAYITAFNPMNDIQPTSTNWRNHERLKEDLRHTPYVRYETESRLEGQSETGFTVEGIPEQEAVALGRKYRQHAILYSDGRGVRLLECEAG